jgi:hypothetical protein
MSFGFLVVVIGADYMMEIQLCPLGFLVAVIGADYNFHHVISAYHYHKKTKGHNCISIM